jgi:polyhydroxyalkanoate synthesis regulator phasin
MIDLFKKTMYMGLGLAEITREKVEEISKELIQKGEISEKEGRSLVEEMTRKSAEARKSLEKQVDRLVAQALDRLNVATKADLAALEKKLSKKPAAPRAKK